MLPVLAVWRAALRATLPPLALRLAPGLAFLAFALSQLWDILPWPDMAAWIQDQGPVVTGVLGSGASLVVALSVRRGLRVALTGPAWTVWRRQPLGPWGVLPVVAVLSAVAAWPLLPLALLAAPLGAVGAWWAVGAATAVVACTPGARGWRRALAGSLVGGGVLGLVQPLPLLGPAIALGLVVALPWLVAQLDLTAGPTASAGWRPRKPWQSLLVRDLLLLGRTERGVVALVLLLVVPAALGLHLVERGLGAEAVATASVLVVGAAGPLTILPLVRLASRLGRRLDPPSWPVTPAGRVLTLLALSLASHTPAWAASATTAPASSGLLALSLAGGAVVLTLEARTRPFAWGWWMWWVLGATLLAVAAPWVLGIAAPLTVAAAIPLARWQRGRP